MNKYYELEEKLEIYIKSEQVTDYEFAPHIPCTLEGLCIREGETLTAYVKLKDGEMFRHIPFDSLTFQCYGFKDYSLNDLIYHNSPSLNITVEKLFSCERPVSVYLKTKDEWVSGKYIFSVDYYDADRMLNLIALDDGQIALQPFHKLKFKEIDCIEKYFKKYKKQLGKYRVEDK